MKVVAIFVFVISCSNAEEQSTLYVPDASPPDAGQIDTIAPQIDAAPAHDVFLGQTDRPTGSACEVDEQCSDGLCLQEIFGFIWDGYCSGYCLYSDECTTLGDSCAAPPGTPIGVCVKICVDESDCRKTYSCSDLKTAYGCVPNP